MLKLIFGRKGSGKTTLCQNAVFENIKNKTSVIYIVPEQEAVKAERRITSLFGNSSNLYVEVINFKRLCNRVFREAGGIITTHIDKCGRLLALNKVLSECRDLLKIYRNSSDDTAFTEKLDGMINDFINAKISPKQLFSLSEKLESDEKTTLSRKLFDLALIYSSYSECLTKLFNDKGDPLDRLYETLKKYPFFSGKTVVIDSFYGFTEAEHKIIEKIADTAENVYITFTCDGKSADELFTRPRESYVKIKDYCESSRIKYECVHLTENFRHKTNSGLYLLEKGFCLKSCAEPMSETSSKDDVEIISCGDIYDECACAASVIHNLVKNGARYRDIAICVSDVLRFDGIINFVFEKQNIPFYMSERESLNEKPIVSALFAAFEIYLSSYSQNSVLKLIKSGLCGLEFDEANLLEKYIRTWRLCGKRFYGEEWDMSPDGYSEKGGDDDNDILCIVNCAKEKVLSLVSPFVSELKSGKTATDRSIAVYSFLRRLKEINLNKENFAKENSTFYNMLFDCLDQIVLVLGDEKQSVRKYSKLLELSVSVYDIGKIPTSLDEVEISPVSLIRADGIKNMIILGANEGILPPSASGASLFSDREKQLLKDEKLQFFSDAAEEIYDGLFLCYCAAASAKERLFVMFENTNTAGETLTKSVFVSMLLNILTGNRITAYPFSEPLLNLGNEEAVFEKLFTFSDRGLKNTLKRYFNSRESYRERLLFLDGDFIKTDYLNEKNANALCRNTLVSSVTRLDTFNRCPFSYFARYTLNLKPEKAAELGAIEIGNISHRVLELYCKALAKKKAETGAVFSDDEAKDTVRRICADYLTMFLNGRKGLSKRFVFLYNRVCRTLFEIAKSINSEMSQSLFSPEGFEVNISFDGDIKPLSIELEKDGKKRAVLNIIGQVDRVDTYKKDGLVYVKVVDYKTGVKVFNAKEIAYGINLQMLLYLNTLINNGRGYFSGRPVPCAVLYLPCARPSQNVNLGGEADSSSENSFKANGIVLDDAEVINAMEKGVKGIYIPVKLNKDQSISKNSSVATRDDFLRLLRTSTEAAKKLAEELVSGDIEIKPYRCDELNSCAFCDYSYFCAYDKELHKTRYELEKKAEAEDEGV